MLASLVVALLASSAAPTPLYAIYQAKWHFTPITTTVVFGVYAIAVLAALLSVGKLSDYVGRRPVLLTAIAVHARSLVILATASGVPALLSARVEHAASVLPLSTADRPLDDDLALAQELLPGFGAVT